MACVRRTRADTARTGRDLLHTAGITPAVDEENRAPAGSIIRVLKSLVVVTAQVEHNKGFTTNVSNLDEDSETPFTTRNLELTESGALRTDGEDDEFEDEEDDDDDEAYSLSLACSERYLSVGVVKLLVESDADVNACAEDPEPKRPVSLKASNVSPLCAALYKNTNPFLNHDMASMNTLLSPGGDGSLLVTPARYDDGRLTARLLQGGAAVNSKGYTFYPLEEAFALFQSGYDRPELCRKVTQARVDSILEWGHILLAANSTPDPIRASEALASYTWTEYPELVSFILPFVTEVNYRDSRAGTALYEAERELKWRSNVSKPDYDPIDED
ncbi:hypothetical protein LTR22_019649 [Elasticomyces elasticus]|nr:hypothetical protein LTR22_019649 [Elasticomyces elasticus]